MEEDGLSLDLKAVMLLLEQQIPQGTKRVRARGGKSRERAVGWVSPSLYCPAFWLGAVSKIPFCQLLIVRKVYLAILFD